MLDVIHNYNGATELLDEVETPSFYSFLALLRT